MNLFDPHSSNLFIHLKELKNRVLVCFASIIIATTIAYFYAQQIYEFLAQPLVEIYGNNSSRKLIFTGLTEAFFTYLKIAFFTGFFISFPIIAHQLYYFIAPALYKNEKKIILPYLIAAPTLFLIGALLAYYYIMPLAWQFFISFEISGNNNTLPIILEARISEYLNLSISLIIAFGIAFQLPVILILLTHLGLSSGTWLASKRRHAIVLIFLAAAILTPPDVISQIALAIPLILLYEISILICKQIEKRAVEKYA
jgi:sec-independent protein translocase protein TatC